MRGMENGRAIKRAGLAAALRRHPRRELAIRRLFDADEGFRDICEELSDAELALSQVDDLPAAMRAARRAEWQELVERLARELETTVREREMVPRSSVIQLRR
jgi:hypothetical protein